MSFKNFIESKTAPGIILCISAVLALIFANSPLNSFYEEFKNIPVLLQVGSFSIDKPLLLWINDGLMAIFFLLVGLEIKRELIEGHLSDYRQALLPAIAALGGLIVPALIYSYFNWADPITIQGWAIPAATDVALIAPSVMAGGITARFAGFIRGVFFVGLVVGVSYAVGMCVWRII